MAVTEAVENYLEAILVLKRKQPDVHAIDFFESEIKKSNSSN